MRRTIEELVERRLLTRTSSLTASDGAGALLRKTPLPKSIHLFANERQARRDAMSALSPTGATFVKAWIAALLLAESGSSNRHDDWGDWLDGDWGGGD